MCRGFGDFPFAALILIHTSVGLMLYLGSVIGSRICFRMGSQFLYILDMPFILAPDWPAMYVVCMSSFF